MSQHVTLKINHKLLKVPKDTTVLQVALKNNIYIPHLCYHPDLKSAGVCRLCIVEIEGRKLSTSCNLKVEEGLSITTDSSRIKQLRRVIIELLITYHQGNYLKLSKTDDSQLRKVAAYVGIKPDRLRSLRGPTETTPIDKSNPFFNRDHNKCILCGICVRTCQELQKVSCIDFAFRGYNTKVSTFANKPIVESNCESCGECVMRCPTGALLPKKFQTASRKIKTICSYCGVGCGMYLGIRGKKIVSVIGDKNNPVNRGSLCVKGRFGYDFVNHPERLTSPLIKKTENSSGPAGKKH